MNKNHRQYENRVKQNATIIFILAVLLCGGMIHYIINAKKSINSQRDNIIKNEEILTLTNSLIEKINTAQSHANLYTLSGDDSYLKDFKSTTALIPKLRDSITSLCNENFNTKTLNDIIVLLEKKEKNIDAISKQLNSFNPYIEIYSIIDSYRPIQKNTTISKTIQDTIVYKPEKKKFFKRLGEVFSPNSASDSVLLVYQTTVDTILENHDEAEELLNVIQLSTEKSRKEYRKQIEDFERKYKDLTIYNQNITKEISDLLINLHKNTINAVIKEIQQSEIIINRNINLSILIASIALLTILTFILLIFYDVKKVKAARKATEEAKKRTEEIMESRHKLLLSVSHDIKAPLSSILGYLELMQLDCNTKDEEGMISSMRSSSEHILSLLTNLLNFSRLDQGKETPILSDFNISKLCNELNEMFMPIAINKHLDFIYENNLKDNIFIKSDSLKIKQILSNLLSNAIKYTIDGNISFIVNCNDNELIFNICDEGIGIPQDKLEEIFKPFSRIDNQESFIEGNGFGLFVVKGLIDLLNGDIKVSSELDKGSVFTVTIPVEFVDPDNGTKHQDKNVNNILVVDDDNTLLSVVEAMLKKLDIRCDICQSPGEFDRYYEKLNDYDIILTDREMGAFSGLEVLKKVKEAYSDKKVILMTARSEYNKDIAIDKGFDGYLRKPFSIKDLSKAFSPEAISGKANDDSSIYHDDFPELCEMFGNDDEAIENILRTFVETTSNNLVTFNDIINNDDFNGAVNLCHKMYPMFVQLNRHQDADFLSMMDKMRDKECISFPEWKEKSVIFMNNVDDFIAYLSERYDI